MRLQLVDVVRQHGSHVVLDGVSLQVNPGHAARARRAKRLRQVDAAPDPRRSRAAGQRHDRPRAGDADRRLSAAGARDSRRASRSERCSRAGPGVAAADLELAGAAEELAAGATRVSATRPRSTAFSRSAAAISRRARRPCSRSSGCPSALDRPVEQLSGGEAARLALAAILLSRYDVLLLDEPTNDLDFDGLERLERFVATTESALVVVSHDRAFLDRTVTRIAEIEDGRGRVREFAGGWTEYAAARDAARAAQYERFEEAQERRQELSSLLNERRNQARAGRRHGRPPRHACADDEGAAGGAAARPQRAAARSRSSRGSSSSGSRREPGRAAPWPASPARSPRRGDFTLGPIDLDLVPGERLAVTGRNGSGKSTLLGMLLGELPLERGRARARPHDGDRHDRAGARRARRDAAPRRVRRRRPASPPSMPERCSPSSGSAPTTSGGPGRRCRRGSERGRTWPSCRHGA